MISGQGAAARVLFVSDERGWPRTSGYRRRTSQLLRSLAAIGPTIWVVAPRNSHDSGEAVELPDDLAHRVTVIHVPAPDRGRLSTAARWVVSGLPWPLAAGNWSRVDQVLAGLADQPFDIVWAMGIDALLATRRAGIGARTSFVDADLESLKLSRQLESGSDTDIVRRLIMRQDKRRWHRLERDAAATTTGFSVCSDAERRLLGESAFATVNSYSASTVSADGPAAFARRRDSGDAILFVGSLAYQPNLDGLRWFIEEVWPTISDAEPDLRFRIVGSGGARVSSGLPLIEGADRVDVVGPVADLEQEIDRARLTVVPLQWGAGTRIKILESFAHRVPVVSTTLGAEGLNAENERELLLADDSADFAEACLRIHRDDELARRLAEAGHQRFRADYEESAVRHALTTRLVDVLSRVAPSTDR